MRKFLLLIGLSCVCFLACQNSQSNNEDVTKFVNPFIGTDFTGNTYPGAQVPFGMVQLSPDNGLPGWDRISGYYYPDSTIAGFSHTHLSGTGAGDLYDISFMPVTIPYKQAEEPLGIYSKFSHKNETASPGYYQVYLDDYDVNVELSATTRCGIQQYTFPRSKAAVFLNLKKAMNWDKTCDSYIEKVDNQTIRGYRFSSGWAAKQRVYFYAHFSKPFTSMNIDTTHIYKENKKTGTTYIARFDFEMRDQEKLLVKTAISPVSMEGAQKNFEAEATSNKFTDYVAAAKNQWNTKLQKIRVESEDRDQLATFYTAMYHAFLAPTTYCDVDGKYFGPDYKIHQAKGFTNYSTFSLWDTYRAAHPLYTYIAPKENNDMIKSFLDFCDQNGRLPVWNFQGNETDMMIGYHSVPVIVDAFLKNQTDFDANRALQACIKTANINDYRAIGLYKKLGYVPYNKEGESLSKTLEYAYDDYCIFLMARKLGKNEVADEFLKRSMAYKKLYNPATSFLQPKDDKGNFIDDFHAEAYTEHITESNAWQYFWSVPQDIDGLIDIVGGKERFTEKLDSMFTFDPTANHELPIFSTGMIGQYAHGNEPSHHVIYLYNKVGQAWKTQKYAAEVMHKLYTNRPDGLCGNEDCGQMSAWYVFSAMGFYPVDPVSGKYEMGTPLFKEMHLSLENGKTFTVLAPKVSKKNIYVHSVLLDGKPYTKTYITHDIIMSGATLQFEMSDKPLKH